MPYLFWFFPILNPRLVIDPFLDKFGEFIQGLARETLPWTKVISVDIDNQSDIGRLFLLDTPSAG